MSFFHFVRQTKFFKWIYRFRLVVLFYHYVLSFFGALIYFYPSKKILIVGVTGTKGKTTVLEIFKNILEGAGKKTALLSSLYIKIGDEQNKNPTDNTMPGRMFIHKFLKRAKMAKCEVALIEVTSEGVVFSRHRFINWGVALLTNLAPEHIEAHGSFEKYRQAKLNFFKYARSKKAEIFFNQDDKSIDFFKNEFDQEKINLYSKKDLQDYFLLDKDHYLFSSEFNQENLAAAVSLARFLKIDDQIIKQAILKFSGVPGRMEVLKASKNIGSGEKKEFKIVIDYAHTPDSLEKVYLNLKSGTKKLICVLGSAGGGRDKWKRPKMGEIASRYCDKLILTNEDPYDENPEKIISEIKSGILKKEFLRDEVFENLDREQAIKKAIELAGADDVVVITGKGSEQYIRVAVGKKIPWSDREVALRTLENLK